MIDQIILEALRKANINARLVDEMELDNAIWIAHKSINILKEGIRRFDGDTADIAQYLAIFASNAWKDVSRSHTNE